MNDNKHVRTIVERRFDSILSALSWAHAECVSLNDQGFYIDGVHINESALEEYAYLVTIESSKGSAE